MTFNDDHKIETYKSLIVIAAEGQKAILYLNGGAIVALLAYFGQTKLTTSQAHLAAIPVSLFIMGLVIGTLSYLTSYRTQLALYSESNNGVGTKGLKHTSWLQITSILAISSLACFATGAYLAIPVVIH